MEKYVVPSLLLCLFSFNVHPMLQKNTHAGLKRVPSYADVVRRKASKPKSVVSTAKKPIPTSTTKLMPKPTQKQTDPKENIFTSIPDELLMEIALLVIISSNNGSHIDFFENIRSLKNSCRDFYKAIDKLPSLDWIRVKNIKNVMKLCKKHNISELPFGVFCAFWNASNYDRIYAPATYRPEEVLTAVVLARALDLPEVEEVLENSFVSVPPQETVDLSDCLELADTFSITFIPPAKMLERLSLAYDEVKGIPYETILKRCGALFQNNQANHGEKLSCLVLAYLGETDSLSFASLYQINILVKAIHFAQKIGACSIVKTLLEAIQRNPNTLQLSNLYTYAARHYPRVKKLLVGFLDRLRHDDKFRVTNRLMFKSKTKLEEYFAPLGTVTA